MRTLTITVTCDLCGTTYSDESSEIQLVRLIHEGGAEYEADVCDGCRYGSQLQEFRKVPKSAANSKTRSDRLPTGALTSVCPVCDRAFHTERGLNQHITKTHN